MDFVDDLGLIDHDIKMFRENKDKYWMEKLNKDNTRMYVNTQLKGQSNGADSQESINPVQYDPMNTQVHGGMPERELLLISPKKSESESLF